MPKLDDEKRAEIERKLATTRRIKESFEGRQLTSQHCRLCNLASNGLTFDEAIAENRIHEQTHPELAELEAATISFRDVRDNLHDHECVMTLCSCKCGCTNGPSCVLLLGPLCATCIVRVVRGDSEHG